MAQMCDVIAKGGPCDGATLETNVRWNNRYVYNVAVPDTGALDSQDWPRRETLHRYVKAGRSERAVYDGTAKPLLSTPLDDLADATVTAPVSSSSETTKEEQ